MDNYYNNNTSNSNTTDKIKGLINIRHIEKSIQKKMETTYK